MMRDRVTKKSTVFPGIGPNPSLLGFGLMRLPTLTNPPDAIDEALAEKMVDLAYQSGVTYFDTAYPYHHGESEVFIGKAMKKYPRGSFFLATKMPGWSVHSADDAKRIFEEQLQKCQVTYFDFYLCHALSRKNIDAYRLPGVMDFLIDMKRQGKIRHLGFSFHDTPEILEDILPMTAWDFVQIQLNYLDWTMQNAKTQYDIIAKAKLPCIVMEPIRGGTLATLSEPARKILQDANPKRSVASWALRYAASKPNVMVVLSGMSNMDQTMDNIHTMSPFEPITPIEQGIIDQALAEFLKNRLIPCTGCGYCLPCPYGVLIPNNFRCFNEFAVSQDQEEFIFRYERLDPAERASVCVSCGHCLSLCPQRIAIPDELEKITELYSRFKIE
jgi:hypothetical protein